MKITSEIPESVIEQAICNEVDINRTAKEALLVELFRRKVISHAALRDALGLSLLETDTLLKERRIPLGPASREEQIERNRPSIEAVRMISAMPVSSEEPSWETVKAAILRHRTER